MTDDERALIQARYQPTGEPLSEELHLEMLEDLATRIAAACGWPLEAARAAVHNPFWRACIARLTVEGAL